MTFTTPDGVSFESRKEYRTYMMEHYLSLQNLSGGLHIKERGKINGQPFRIVNATNCTLVVPDHCEQVTIDNCKQCRIFIGASSGSIFIRDCQQCSFTIACNQLRTRDCTDCTLNLFCVSEPVIESSTNMRFAPFNGVYHGHDQDMRSANLPLETNLWYAVYDYCSNSSNTNFKILESEEWDDTWEPVGPIGEGRESDFINEDSYESKGCNEYKSIQTVDTMLEIVRNLLLEWNNKMWSSFSGWSNNCKICWSLGMISATLFSFFMMKTKKKP